MNCPTGTVTGNVATGATLTGVTAGTASATCSWGYTFGGMSSTTYQKTFTCVGTGDALNEWQPATSMSDNECLGMFMGGVGSGKSNVQVSQSLV